MATQSSLENQTYTVQKTSRAQRTVVPRTDIYETADALVLLSDMPGVKQENLEITLENDVLILSGTVEPAAHAGFELAYAEYEASNYRRVFTLNTEIARDKIEASIKDGVLKLVLPKAEPAKARKITVKAA